MLTLLLGEICGDRNYYKLWKCDDYEKAHKVDISIGTATLKGTAMERFFPCGKTVVENMIAKFLYNNQTLVDLALLDPPKRSTVASTVPIVRLWKGFVSEDPSRIDEVVISFWHSVLLLITSCLHLTLQRKLLLITSGKPCPMRML